LIAPVTIKDEQQSPVSRRALAFTGTPIASWPTPTNPAKL